MTINVAPPDSGPSTNMALPRGKWTCFEWQIAQPSTGKGNVILFRDGKQLAADMNTQIPTLVFQRVGYERYASGTAGEMWIDDYAIGTQRLTCN